MGTIFCNEIWFQEFPDLLFGKTDEGTYYFDATTLISRSGKQDKSISGFKTTFAYFIQIISDVYSLTPDQIFITSDKHTLIDETLALLFIAYLDNGFIVYMLERIADLLVSGVVLSDTYLISITRDRFTRDQLLQLTKNEE